MELVILGNTSPLIILSMFAIYFNVNVAAGSLVHGNAYGAVVRIIWVIFFNVQLDFWFL